MKFTTNKYTRPVLLQSLKSINARNYTNYSSFVNAFSPRAGKSSAKLASLRTALGITNLESAFSNNASLSNVQKKRALISALKNS